MFNAGSWESYWISLVICLAIYYLVIFLLYYRRDFRMSFLNKTTNLKQVADDSEFQAPVEDSEEGIVYACMDELNAFFEQAKKRKWNKNELIYALVQILKKYPSINSSEYKQSVFNVLLSQCEHICSVHINREELSGIWLGE